MRSKFLALVSALLLAILAAALLGVSVISPSQLWHGLTDSTSPLHSILWEIRLPRIALALLVGSALAVAGALSQSVFANPIAEPSIIGVASGAAFGLLISVLVGVATIGSPLSLAAALIGALVLATLLNRYADHSPLVFLLTGIAVAAVLNALVGVLTSIGGRGELRSISFWTLGSLSLATWSNVYLILPFVVMGISLAVLVSPSLDYLALGAESARHLGINARRVRLTTLVAMSLLASAGVAVTGIIAFVGLAVPHVVRLFFGTVNREVIAFSAIVGAALVLLADTLARSVFQPIELPIGLLTALLGSPALLVGLKNLRRVND